MFLKVVARVSIGLALALFLSFPLPSQANAGFEALSPVESFFIYEVYWPRGGLSWRIEVYPDGRALLSGVNADGPMARFWAGESEEPTVLKEIFRQPSFAKALYEALTHSGYTALPAELTGPGSSTPPFYARLIVMTTGQVKRTVLKGYAKSPALDRVFKALERYVGVYPYSTKYEDVPLGQAGPKEENHPKYAGPMVRYIVRSSRFADVIAHNASFEVAVYEDGFAIYAGPKSPETRGIMHLQVREGGIQRLRNAVVESGLVGYQVGDLCTISQCDTTLEVSEAGFGSGTVHMSMTGGPAGILKILLTLQDEVDTDEFRCHREDGSLATCAREKEYLKEAYRDALGRSK